MNSEPRQNDQAGISNIQGYFVEYPVDDYPEPPVAPEPPPLEWFRQHGASYISSVSAGTDGRIFISGSAAQSLTSDESDAHVAQYDTAGNLLWSRQLGTSSYDTSNAVSGDGLGSVYIAGETEASLGGPNFGGSSDAYLAKFDQQGNELWTRQIGTVNNDVAFGVSADGRGSVYVGGRTGGSLGGTNVGSFDPFLSRYDDQGNVVWHRQLGTSEWDVGYAVSADCLGNVYLTGSTEGSLGGPYRGGFGDVFVSKYDEMGNFLWSRQLGSIGQDIAWGIAADALGNVFVAGNAEGALPGSSHQGRADAFLAMYDAEGNRAWIRQFGTDNTDIAWSVSADGLGNVYVSGEYRQQDPGGFLRKYSAEGDLLWEELARNAAVAADGLHNVYLAGTNFEIGSFIAKYSEIPEPNVSLLAWAGSTALLVRRARHNQ